MVKISGKVVSHSNAYMNFVAGEKGERATIIPDPVDVSKLKVGDKVLHEVELTEDYRETDTHLWTKQGLIPMDEVIVLLPKEPGVKCSCGKSAYSTDFKDCPIHGKPTQKIEPIDLSVEVKRGMDISHFGTIFGKIQTKINEIIARLNKGE